MEIISQFDLSYFFVSRIIVLAIVIIVSAKNVVSLLSLTWSHLIAVLASKNYVTGNAIEIRHRKSSCHTVTWEFGELRLKCCRIGSNVVGATGDHGIRRGRLATLLDPCATRDNWV